MGTLTQQPITEDQINQLVKLHFGHEVFVKTIEKFNDGFFSTTMKLSLQFPSESKEIVLKIAPSPEVPLFYFEKGAGLTELSAIKYVLNKTNVPVPRIHSSREDHLQHNSILPRDYFFMDYIPATSWNRLKPKLNSQINENIEMQVAESQFQINSIIGDRFGTIFDDPKNEVHEPTWSGALLKMFQLIIKNFHEFNASLPISEEILLNFIKNHAKDLDEVKEPHLVHWDIWPPNVLIQEHEGKFLVAAIIDFERAFWGDPLAEWCFMDYNKTSHFLKRYGEHIFSQKSARIRRNLYTIYFALTEVLSSDVHFSGFFRKLRMRRYNTKWIKKSVKAIIEDESIK